MAYPDPKGERDNRMPGKRRSGPGAGTGASRDPRDMAKAGLLEPQSPDDAKYTSAGTAPDTGVTLCDWQRTRAVATFGARSDAQ